MSQEVSPLKVTVKEGRVSITFDSRGWDDAISELLEFYGRRASEYEVSIADSVCNSILLMAPQIHKSLGFETGNFENLLEGIRADIKRTQRENSELNTPPTIDR